MLCFAADPADRDENLEHTFQDLTHKQPVAPADITVQMGRKLHVEKAGAAPAARRWLDLRKMHKCTDLAVTLTSPYIAAQ